MTNPSLHHIVIIVVPNKITGLISQTQTHYFSGFVFDLISTTFVISGNQTLGNQYVTSLYWAAATSASVGYGDIHAYTAPEVLCLLTKII